MAIYTRQTHTFYHFTKDRSHCKKNIISCRKLNTQKKCEDYEGDLNAWTGKLLSENTLSWGGVGWWVVCLTLKIVKFKNYQGTKTK